MTNLPPSLIENSLPPHLAQRAEVVSSGVLECGITKSSKVLVFTEGISVESDGPLGEDDIWSYNLMPLGVFDGLFAAASSTNRSWGRKMS